MHIPPRRRGVEEKKEGFTVAVFLEDSKKLWDTYILPPVPTQEEVIAEEIAKLKLERRVINKELSTIRYNIQQSVKLARKYANERNTEERKRAIYAQVQGERKEKFMRIRQEKLEHCIEQIMVIKGDQQQTVSRLRVMNAVTKQSINIEDAKVVTNAYGNYKRTMDQVNEVVEDALEMSEEEENDFLNEDELRRVEELEKNYMDISNYNLLKDIPQIDGIVQDFSGQENMSEREMMTQSKMDAKKLDQYLISQK